ncbi:Hypothetical protein GbCGDNIH9_7107 [Granulibacter bethesdensis]|uniref:Uncharacterized protein n=1 Tax=Granulibacter bethesdensis TaxID=364410 RepID=A0AAC9KB39_9PROT|nr:Hypothetical protein GbCGDNIH9_7107 [Granulibacter bethesdensis]APH62150.1 Hypothetical protein GbCGDNIH8_7107 [Granulibacter bethesdensis]
MLVCSMVRSRLLRSGPTSSAQQPDRQRHTGGLKKASALDGLQVMHFSGIHFCGIDILLGINSKFL